MIGRLALCLILLPGLAGARTASKPPPGPPAPSAPLTPPAMCEAAIAGAEKDAKLPSRVLAAIAMRESGRFDPETRRSRPWPWTINFEGTGHVYETKEQAIAAVQEIQAGGGQSIDVGCMQVNLMHHSAAFATLEEAFDPAANARYSGRFLKGLFASSGDWGTAIGSYHSRTPGRSEAYRDQVVATWRPTDPKVLAHLTLTPAVPPPDGTAVAAGMGTGTPLPRVAVVAPTPIRMGPNMAYRSFAGAGTVYGSFQMMSVAYADFAPKGQAKGQRRPVVSRPLDLGLSLGVASGSRGLVVPKGVVATR